MLTLEENELLTRTGAGYADGRADAALLASGGVVLGAAGARLPAGASEALGRGDGDVP